MHAVSAGGLVVVGQRGVRVVAPSRARGETAAFEFMNSEVSSEKPKALLVGQLARQIAAARPAGQRVLFVCGPVIR